jgi:glycosyltransferase involved in cell wall biosynthesis
MQCKNQSDSGETARFYCHKELLRLRRTICVDDIQASFESTPSSRASELTQNSEAYDCNMPRTRFQGVVPQIPTLRELIRNRSNDYSAEEQAFRRETGQELTRVSASHALGTSGKLPRASVSVVVPCYNGHPTIPYLLRSLSNQLYRNFELVLVDDGSTPPIPLALLLDEGCGFDLKLVRARKNLGYSAARNVGIQCAEGEVLILMDDDLCPPESATLAAALRHECVERMVFLAFREDADWTTFTSSAGSVPRLERDWRWITHINPNHVRLSVFNVEQRTGDIRIVEESAMLKQLGFGAALGFWDLPTLVSSHGLSLRRADVIEAGGFVEQGRMNHWGIDDLSFGATLIAFGVKVAPALEWRCWHLKQEGRETTRARQFASFLSRLPDYISYLDQPWPAQNFPVRRIIPISRQGSLEELAVA